MRNTPRGSEYSDVTFEWAPIFSPAPPREHQCMPTRIPNALATALAAGVLAASFPAHALDAAAAEALARENKCLRCHGIEKDKDGPSFRKVSARYRGKADAEARLVFHLTSNETVKFPDGHEEEHRMVKTSPARDAAQVKNLIQWILAQ